MNTTTKLNAKTLIQLLAIAMITLTLFSCGDTATKVSTLSALATGEPSQVNIYWSEVAEATSYKLYKSTTTLSGYQNANPTNLSTSSTVTVTTLATNTTNITLSGTQTFYFLVTAIKDNNVESFTNATQTAATAFTMPFLTVVATDTNNRVWMDRNLGATRTATSSTDALAYGDLYQWGRPRDGHQARTSTTSTAELSDSVTPTHGQFITNAVAPYDWTTTDADRNGTLRSAYWVKTDGSSICPTGFRVPTQPELRAEFNSWSSGNAAGAYASNLKLPLAGQHSNDNDNLTGLGIIGYLWGLTSAGNNYASLIFASNQGFTTTVNGARGYSVRCIKD